MILTANELMHEELYGDYDNFTEMVKSRWNLQFPSKHYYSLQENNDIDIFQFVRLVNELLLQVKMYRDKFKNKTVLLDDNLRNVNAMLQEYDQQQSVHPKAPSDVFGSSTHNPYIVPV